MSLGHPPRTPGPARPTVEPIVATPLGGTDRLRLIADGQRHRVRWDWLRVLGTTVDEGSGRVRRATVIALLTADDQTGVLWRPDEVEIDRLRRPGTTSLIAVDPDDPAVWTLLRWWEDEAQPPSGDLGWSGGDVAGGLPQFDADRARFLAGPRATAVVQRVRAVPGSTRDDAADFEITFAVDGRRVLWAGRLAVVADELRRGDQVEVALDDDGAIAVLDCDERYVSDHGRCPAWSSDARRAASARRAVKTPAPRASPEPAAPRVAAAPPESAPSSAPVVPTSTTEATEATEVTEVTEAVLPTTAAPLARGLSDVAATDDLMPVDVPVADPPPAAQAVRTWAGALAIAKLRNEIASIAQLDAEVEPGYERRVRALLERAVGRGEVDGETRDALLDEAGVPRR